MNVPLSRISTNRALNLVFFNNRYIVPGSAKSPRLGAQDVIFVLEDVDATSEAVMRRDSPLYEQMREAKQKAADEAAAAAATAAAAIASSIRTSNILGSHFETNALKNEDELNLSGLLNVLDGVVDTPGRIVIMTTNHPELLDPALIRPGRIDKTLELGYMLAVDVIAMLEHYYQTRLTDSEKEAIERLVDGDKGEDGVGRRPGLRLIPANVERFTMEVDDVPAMIKWLEQPSQGDKNDFGL